MNGSLGVFNAWLPIGPICVSVLSFTVAVDSNRRSRAANTAEQQIAVWRLEDELKPLLRAVRHDRRRLEKLSGDLTSVADVALPAPLTTKMLDLLQLTEVERYLRLDKKLGVKLRGLQIDLAEYNEDKADAGEAEETPASKRLTVEDLLKKAHSLEGAISDVLEGLEHLGFVGRKGFWRDVRDTLKVSSRP